MIKMSLLVTPYITGMIHMQTNPRYASDTEATISNGLRKRFQIPGLKGWESLTSDRYCDFVQVLGYELRYFADLREDS